MVQWLLVLGHGQAQVAFAHLKVWHLVALHKCDNVLVEVFALLATLSQCRAQRTDFRFQLQPPLDTALREFELVVVHEKTFFGFNAVEHWRNGLLFGGCWCGRAASATLLQLQRCDVLLHLLLGVLLRLCEQRREVGRGLGRWQRHVGRGRVLHSHRELLHGLRVGEFGLHWVFWSMWRRV